MKNTLLTLHAQTSIHAGMGSTDSVIDLPIQREPHTGYPCIYGSSVKGALRCKSEQQQSQHTELLFGAANGKDNSNDGNAGCLLISDARLLLLPVRSLTGNFRYVTCPHVLRRFKQDAERFGTNFTFNIPEVENGTTITHDDGWQGEALYLEEYRLSRANTAIEDKLIEALAQTLNDSDSTAILQKQLAIISDDDFAYLAKYTLPVNPHIAIDSDTKIVRTGALWYEETLPAETLLYIGITATDSRKDETKADTIFSLFSQLFSDNAWLQIGGNETVGMGWCKTKLLVQGE